MKVPQLTKIAYGAVSCLIFFSGTNVLPANADDSTKPTKKPCNCHHKKTQDATDLSPSPVPMGGNNPSKNPKVSASTLTGSGSSVSPALQTGAQSTTLQTGTQSTTLQTGTQSTTLQTGTQSTTLQTGTQSTTLQTGTQSTLIQGGAKGTLIQGQVQDETGPVNILLVIDASFSMKERLGGSIEKMEAAKQVVQNAMSRIPNDVNLGLRVFGQGFSNDPFFDCQQSALLVPMGQGNRRSIIERVREVHPFGLTPLAYALMQAERDLRTVSGSKTLILITDGQETCGGDPCAYVRRLNQIGIKMKVDIVGLGLRRERSAREQLHCIAEASGGKYYDADTAAELIESVSHSVDKAISGRIITKLKQPASNTQTPLEQNILGPLLGK